jgi:hypothetical protein
LVSDEDAEHADGGATVAADANETDAAAAAATAVDSSRDTDTDADADDDGDDTEDDACASPKQRMVKKVHYDNTPNTIRKRQMEARTIGHL